MRDLHAQMLSAILDGEGLGGVAELAALEAGAPVAIVLPARGLAAASETGVQLETLIADIGERLRGGSGATVEGVVAEHRVDMGGETIGFVLALHSSQNGGPQITVDREEVLRTAALAALTEVAVADARDEVASEVRGSLLEDIRAGRASLEDIRRRAARVGCDLDAGAVVLVANIHSSRPRHAAAMVAGEHPGAIAEVLACDDAAGSDGAAPRERLYAILPARPEEGASERTVAVARSLAARLRPHGVAAFSSFCSSAADLERATAEAELALDVITRDERMADQLEEGMSSGVYRLLFRALATDPAEVHRFYADTVEPLVAHDAEYRTDLLGTLESYLENDCNMNATARAVYAHRHTVAHRLGRIRELTGLDPAIGEDRERLGLGIKAYRIIAPTLHR